MRPLDGDLACPSGPPSARAACARPRAPRDAVERERPVGDRPADRLEQVERLGADDVAHDAVQRAIVEDRVGPGAAAHGEVHLERLRQLALVRQEAHAHVEAHAGERDRESARGGAVGPCRAHATLVMRRVSSLR